MKLTKRISLVVASFAFAAAWFCGQATAAEISHVVLIGVDGAGAFFKQADTPNLDKIFKNGAVTYDAITSNPTISAECWGSMLHGVTPDIHGLTNSIVGAQPYPVDSEFPSCFRVIRENMPDAKLASFCNWNPINVGIIEDNLDVVKGTAGDDAKVTDLICEYLGKNKPTFLFVQFDNVDGAGHGNGYGTEGHLKQINITDGYVQRIYDACKESGILDSTLFIVTADHGGAGKSHGGWTDGEKKIMFAAVGPNVEAGTVGEMGVRDISSVVLYALGLADKQPESWTSRVPSGLFKGVKASARPVYTIKYAYEHRTHETTATPTGAASVPEVLGKERVCAYFPFDGDVNDALGKIKTEQNGKFYFVDGYFGKGAKFDDGYVALPGFKPGVDSYSAAFWVKTGGVSADPPIFSNKDWRNGTLPGFVLALRQGDIDFNVADQGVRFDRQFKLPKDFRDGWVHVAVVLDRKANELRFAYDFGEFTTVKLPENFANASFDSFPTLNIGQDGTGKYRVGLGAELDEVVLIAGAMTNEDLAKLKKVYLGK